MKSILFRSAIAQEARSKIGLMDAVEIFPPMKRIGPPHPLLSGLTLEHQGEHRTLSQGARGALIHALIESGAVYSNSPSFRSYEMRQRNRLTDFWYFQFGFRQSQSFIQAFSVQLFDAFGNLAKQFDPGAEERNSSALPLCEVSFSDFCSAAGISDDHPLTLEEEIACVEALGGTPLIVTGYTVASKPNIPDLKRDPGSERLLAFSLVMPGVGSIIDGGELETDRDKLIASFDRSQYLHKARQQPEFNSEFMDEYIELLSNVKGPLSIGGFGLERCTQYFLGLESIEQTVSGPISILRSHPEA